MDLEGNRELALEIYETSIHGDIEKENGDSIVATEKLLREIRSNCVYLSIYHNRRYHFYKNILFTIFRVPPITYY
jgi:hypothetical protein